MGNIEIPLVGLMVEESIPLEILEEVFAELRAIQVVPSLTRTNLGPQATLELYIPTAICLFVAKPFFYAFLKKAGEDAYIGLKSALARLCQRSSKFKTTIVTRSPEKINLDSAYSRVFSIISKTRDGATVKFLMPAVVSSAESAAIMDSLFKLIGEHHSGNQPNRLDGILRPAGGITLMYLVAYSLESATWELINPFLPPSSSGP